jgi:type IV pilus assembly protein PilQ
MRHPSIVAVGAVLFFLFAPAHRTSAAAQSAGGRAGVTPRSSEATSSAPRTPSPEDETRISVDLKEVSILDLLRLLAEVGGFQLVADPGITCNLTLKLKDVPWPRVLDVALKTCRLSSEDDNGIIRVAPAARLMQEHTERRQLEEAKMLAGPIKVTRHRLSYARAEQVAPILRKFLSPRGEVVVDPRTNTLIIMDVE